MVKARQYQIEAVQKIRRDWEQGYNGVLLTMATGGGKTYVFLSLIDQLYRENPRSRFLVLAHREELIFQPRDRMVDYYPEWQGRIGIVMADQDEVAYPLTIATVQTLASERRLERLLAAGKIDYLVVDESHHVTAESYIAIIDRLREANPKLKVLGVTATPIRADGDGLAKVFQKESAHYGIVELIQMGYLVPVRWLAIQVRISLKSVKSSNGDYVARQLADVFETDNCFDLVVQSHQQYADGRQAVAFTVSVDGAFKLAEKFNAAGIPAAAACGETDKRARAKILDDFRLGKTRVLCNVGLYTEGLDIPEVSCIHQVRPTKSDGLYTQIVGRALRTFPGKEDALVLDYCPLESRNIAMMGDVLGVPLRKDAYVKQAKEGEEYEQGEILGGFTFDGKYKWLEGSPTEIISRQLDYLKLSPFRWYRSNDGSLSLGLGTGSDEIDRTLFITPPREGEITLRMYMVWKKVDEKYWKGAPIKAGTFEELSAWADEYAAKRGNATLAMKKRRWQKEAPREEQIKFARALHVYQDGLSRGELAARITHALALRAVGGVRV